MIKIFKKVYRDDIAMILAFLVFLGVSAITFYYLNGQITLYADTMSRLDIARKVIDNLNPGLAQLGNVWLPLPQFIMIPLIWNNFLWHSGLAGSITSSTAFIIAGIYIYLTALLLTKSKIASFFSLCIFALNINILYLQTTAMSETMFLLTLSATLYYLLKWYYSKNKMYLIPAGASVAAMTLSRYEGWSIFFAGSVTVFIVAVLRNKKFSEAEGQTILFTILAITGLIAWTLYLATIFNDPFYWLHYYATPQATGGVAAVYTQQKPFLSAVWQYFTATVWMDGIIPVTFAILGSVILLIKSTRERSYYFLIIYMPLALYLFMVLTLQRNTPIVQPTLSIQNILSDSTSKQTGFNIRYGILLIPLVAILASYLFSLKKFGINILFFFIFLVQIYTYFYPTHTLIYQIPARIYGKPYSSVVNYMKSHYTGGEIMISASSMEDQMFQMGFNYRDFIHEGAGKYWKESIDNPPRYATWVVINYGKKEDAIAIYKKRLRPILDRQYNEVFFQEQVGIYKIKTKPYISI